MGRVIKVTICGEQEVCGVNDRISIEFSPFEILALTRTFGSRALILKSHAPGNDRAMHDVFVAARDIWSKMRKKRKQNFIVEDLLKFDKDVSILPLLLRKPNEPPSEILTCTSISADSVDFMPKELTLVRKDASGESNTALYKRQAKKRKRKGK